MVIALGATQSLGELGRLLPFSIRDKLLVAEEREGVLRRRGRRKKGQDGSMVSNDRQTDRGQVRNGVFLAPVALGNRPC